MTRKTLMTVGVVMGAVLGVGIGAASAGVEKLYVLDCGQNVGKDQSRWSPGVNEGKAIEFSDNCYLIRHGKQWMLWDTGLPDDIAKSPECAETWARTPARTDSISGSAARPSQTCAGKSRAAWSR